MNPEPAPWTAQHPAAHATDAPEVRTHPVGPGRRSTHRDTPRSTSPGTSRSAPGEHRADGLTVTLPSPVPLARARVHPLTREQATGAVIGWAAGRVPALVVTPNVDHVVMLEHDERFQDAYEAARLQLCDGMPLVLLSRLSGTSLPERVTGADLFFDVCARAAEEGLRVFIAGGMPEVLAKGLAALRERFPSLDITGHSPPRGFEGTAHDEELQSRITEAAPDIVMVCLGAPRSEVWAREQSERYPAVYLCVGAAIDFAAGTVSRAPAWVQHAGLEWSYRLLQEPRRMWRRYLLRDSAFVGIALRQLWRSR
ncbi:WecB/TagA/CpsF family glycosyltransferase [Paenibacillus sp. TRM 82003]|uniref:WecB/TagA/CpsF family glycosyltransferase n=1 Tax=Kineococcus sp. TRM81007 TaxID=2925831 RepID=UPI001F5A60CB|nr:WecB/TagA/CpsF family glycosyltransferase [Kineococcus sp. TRM81007]MCI2238415.1 WecB/TagA/CpsF family glycosyltransferase [Kineococcus sp. TRM81007]MCI3922072.1 WecB/TagA/CpsF family glycosyltransferase [Paenibacillus sp. TRM 82003]